MGDEGLELALEAVKPRGVFGFQSLQLFSRLLSQPRLERHALTEMTWWTECFLWIVERERGSRRHNNSHRFRF